VIDFNRKFTLEAFLLFRSEYYWTKLQHDIKVTRYLTWFGTFCTFTWTCWALDGRELHTIAVWIDIKVFQEVEFNPFIHHQLNSSAAAVAACGMQCDAGKRRTIPVP